MGTLYVTEYQNMGRDWIGAGVSTVPAALEPALARQIVSIGAGSAQSATFQANTQYVRLNTDETCSVLFGTNPTATTSSTRLAANQTEFFGVLPNSNLKVAVIANS